MSKPVAISLSNLKNKKQPIRSVLVAVETKEKKTDYISEFGSTVTGFVIPLQQIDYQRKYDELVSLGKIVPGNDGDDQLSLEDKARLEILKDVSDYTEEKNKNLTIPLNQNIDLPLLMRNPIPGISQTATDTEKYRRHIELLPDEQSPHSDVYDRIPIDGIGAALLRGMGWSEGKAIGKNCKETVKVIEPNYHPSGLGLGANPMPIRKMGAFRPKPGEEVVDLKYQKGAYVGVMGGEYQGHNGVIVKMVRNNGDIDMHVELEDFKDPQIFSKVHLKLIGNLKDFNNFIRKYPKLNESKKIDRSHHNRRSSRSRSRSRSPNRRTNRY